MTEELSLPVRKDYFIHSWSPVRRHLSGPEWIWKWRWLMLGYHFWVVKSRDAFPAVTMITCHGIQRALVLRIMFYLSDRWNELFTKSAL